MMNCYNHPEKPAIAICKNCYKAICIECAIPGEDGFTCSEHCQRQIQVYNTMMEKSKMAYGMAPGRIPILTIFLFVIGAVFVLLGAINLLSSYTFGLFPLSIGIIFLVIGVLSYLNQKKSGIIA